MNITNIDAIQEGVQVVFTGTPDEIKYAYQELGYEGEPKYYPAANIHFTQFNEVIDTIPADKPFATQNAEFVDALVYSKRELQFVTCRKFEDGASGVRSLPKNTVLTHIENFGFEVRL